MSRRPVDIDKVDASWRIDVGKEGPLSVFVVVVDGRSTPLTAEAAKKLVSKLGTWFSVAERFAADVAERFADEESSSAGR